MHNNNLIWYAVYGSNLYYERFACYIVGGKPEGSIKTHIGCRSKKLPFASNSFLLPHELYFSRESASWGGGGVAFLKPEINNSAGTYGRLYLITNDQFEDIVKQENDLPENVTIDYQQAFHSGSIIFNENAWYGRLLWLGNHQSYPVVSITAVSENYIPSKPSHTYLKAIIKGLIQVYGMTCPEIAGYLQSKQGIAGLYNTLEIEQLILSVI
jgi:hypothetical protein